MNSMKQIPALIALTLTAGCGWVDGTGQQGNELPSIEVLFDDGSPFTVVAIPEEDELLVTSTASDRDGVITTWRWSDVPTQSGQLDSCSTIADFDADLSADSLVAACGDVNCGVDFEQREVLSEDGESVTVTGSLDSGSSSTVQFIATMPKVSRPVGVRYRLTATDNAGGRAVTDHTFCINSVNEPPIAVDDVFTMLETDVLQPAAGERNLLTNDETDDDVRNQDLRVILKPALDPLAAADFELFGDGRFRYSFAGTTLVDDVEDRFEYEVTDGTFTSKARVTIRVVAVDDPPVEVGGTSPIVGIVGVNVNDDLNQNVIDPEGATLSFTAVTGSLPPSGDVSVSSNGLLEGIPTPEDVGSYEIEVTASDGNGELDFTVDFDVIENAPIEARAIPDQETIVGERFNFVVRKYFTDPESQPIMFDVETASSIDFTVSDATALVTGFAETPGEFDINIIASDGVTEPTEQSFLLTVLSDNEAPEFIGDDIDSQSLNRGDNMDPIRPEFEDPDGDELTYTMQGNLPPGVRLTQNGVIRGRPTERGDYIGLRVIATDDEGLSARTNLFSLFVR